MPVLDRRRPTQRRPERRVADDDDEDQSELPPYEPLACPLSNEAKRAIAELSNSRDVHRYQNHIKAAIGHITPSIADVNDRLRERHEALQHLAAKRAESDDPDEKSQREVAIEEHVASVLDEEVPRLTAEAEAALRDLIDRQATLDDEKNALVETVEFFQQLPAPPPRPRRRARQQEADELGEDGQEDAEEEDDEPPPPPEHTVIDVLRQHRAEKSREYGKLNAYQRYALNNDYATFKRLWHDAAHGDSGPPLPHNKRWFDDAGNPVMSTNKDSRNVKNDAGGAEEDDDDEDLVIAGEIREYGCPLSLALFKEPYSNRVCSHTYEKQWIIDMLRKAPNQRAECPVAGCSRELGLDDLYFDELILRKMKRAEESQRQAEEEESSSSDENGDDDGAPREVKRQKRSISSKRKVEQIDDE